MSKQRFHQQTRAKKRRRKSTRARRAKNGQLACPKCKHGNLNVMHYPDEGIVMYICMKCSFPWRVRA